MPEHHLDRATHALVELSAALATRDGEVVERALQRAQRDAAATQVEEAILQAHLFIGFPDVLAALSRWRELSAAGPPRLAAAGSEGWLQRGERVCAEVYGRNYGRLRENVQALHPDLDHWMVHGGYGRVIGRDGLELQVRELCIVALLAVWNAPRQLHSHLRGALNVGTPVVAVDQTVESACGFLSEAQAGAVRELWSSVRQRSHQKGAA
jgi:4-carboxymuconolactone decarboxylase